MACQPAVQLGVHLLVAADAESHLEIHLDQTIHAFDVAVANATIDLLSDVGLVIELHIGIPAFCE
jgi:hypothetical protein